MGFAVLYPSNALASALSDMVYTRE